MSFPQTPTLAVGDEVGINVVSLAPRLVFQPDVPYLDQVRMRIRLASGTAPWQP